MRILGEIRLELICHLIGGQRSGVRQNAAQTKTPHTPIRAVGRSLSRPPPKSAHNHSSILAEACEWLQWATVEMFKTEGVVSVSACLRQPSALFSDYPSFRQKANRSKLTSKRSGFLKSWRMAERTTRKQSAKATLAEVTKEMAKPMVAVSAREHSPEWRRTRRQSLYRGA